ncbi:hypothetical protein [Microlunatus flavus]|uniref:Uncharacterized protein n=1 Tax=Microlunatus flavus TaxID=1036181 RepID=A0A1H9LMI1_9ACTN|nr:hypothetical protein [Microlunatus flavus]SER12345.1 hypothetical protein SAMN05421756_10914 [Microlunatus flavus]
MSILNVLAHRATVERSTETMADGVPVRSWSVVGARIPVLLSRDKVVLDPTWTAEQHREAGVMCTLFALPAADIAPGDRVHLTRPALAGTFEVLPDPSAVLDLHGVHHHEHKVRSVA